MSDNLDIGAWIGIITFALAIPVGVMSHVLGHHFVAYLERRKLIKTDAARAQAIRQYELIKALYNGTKDKYAYFLLLLGLAVLCAIASSTLVIIIVLTNPELNIVPGTIISLILAVAFFVCTIVFVGALYETSRRLERFDDYKAEHEQRWGPID